MKKTISEITAFLLLISTAILAFDIQSAKALEPPATQWSRTYGGTSNDGASSMVLTGDGGYAIAGWTYSFGAGEGDFWLVKTDANGMEQWNQTYGGTGRDGAQSLVQTSDGGYAITGFTGSFGAGYARWDCYLVKTDPNGNMEWNKTYGGGNEDYGYSIIQTSDGGYAIAGQTLSFGAGSSDGWLIKTCPDGTMDWIKTYGGAGWDGMFSLVQTSDGGYAMAGFTGTVLVEDFWVVKTDANGIVQWDLTFGGAGRDILRSLAQTGDEGYVAVGYTSPFPPPGPFDACLVKIDANGIIQWSKTYGGENDEYALSGVQSSDGGYAVAGIAGSPDAGTSDFWIFKTDADGSMQWIQTCGGADRDEAYSVVQADDGGYAIAGYTKSFGAGNFDIWLIKLAPEAISWECIFEDTKRDTTLKISTDDKCFQFVASDKTFGVKHDSNMHVVQYPYFTCITICFADGEIKLAAYALDGKFDCCIACAKNIHTGKTHLLIDTPGIE